VNPWIPAAGFLAVAVVVIFVAGLIKGEGDLGNWAGLDWATVDWTAAGETVLVSAVVSAVVLPLLFFGLRGRGGVRAVAMLFAALMIWAPIGLIAPGGAFAEEQTATQQEVDAALQAQARGDSALFDALPDINKECKCVPNKIGDITFANNTILSGYEPPWVNPDTDPAWKQNVGYQIAGVLGIGILGVIGYGLWRFGRWMVPSAPPDWRRAEQ
jgi:hypothetical protein